MSAPIVIGYTATDAGADAAALGARIALATGAPVELVIVLPSDGRSVITPPDASYSRYVEEKAAGWLAEAAAALPASVEHRGSVRFAESFAEGLLDAAHETGATHIVVGAANGGLRGRHRLGTVATELLHFADLPVVLAPEGSRRVPASTGITRITTAIGTRPGADTLMNETVALATATGAAVRLLSLFAVDLPAGLAANEAAASHADEVFIHVRTALPSTIETDTVVGLGSSIEDAVSHLGWQPGELALVGSSRLARPRRLFLGSTAAKMLHELPVPMVVVPRGGKDKRSTDTKKKGGRR